jgi:hypothetical protein
LIGERIVEVAVASCTRTAANKTLRNIVAGQECVGSNQIRSATWYKASIASAGTMSRCVGICAARAMRYTIALTILITLVDVIATRERVSALQGYGGVVSGKTRVYAETIRTSASPLVDVRALSTSRSRITASEGALLVGEGALINIGTATKLIGANEGFIACKTIRTATVSRIFHCTIATCAGLSRENSYAIVLDAVVCADKAFEKKARDTVANIIQRIAFGISDESTGVAVRRLGCRDHEEHGESNREDKSLHHRRSESE